MPVKAVKRVLSLVSHDCFTSGKTAPSGKVIQEQGTKRFNNMVTLFGQGGGFANLVQLSEARGPFLEAPGNYRAR